MWDRSAPAIPGAWRAWRPAMGWAVVIFGLSSIPGTALPELPAAQADKVVHGVVYLVLGLLCGRALRATTRLGAGHRVALAGLLATVYGVTDELHQLLTPRRSCDWHDVVADAVGGLLGAAVAATLVARGPRQPEK
jgi:VanZ family protein